MKFDYLKILDYYIIKKYLTTFAFAILIFTMVSVIIDFSDKVEDFIEEPVTIFQILKQYYLGFMLYMCGMLFPMCALIAVIFFTSRMAYNSEIISILNAGVSFRRLLRPYLVAGTIVAIIHLFGSHFLIPLASKDRLAFERKYVYKFEDKGKSDNVHLFISPDTKIFAKYYGKHDSTIRDLRMEQFANNQLVGVLKARTAKWINSSSKWRLDDYEIRTFDNLHESLQRFPNQTKDTLIKLSPIDFVKYNKQKDALTSAELKANIKLDKERGAGNSRAYELEVHRRTAEPFTIIILTLIGVSLAARKVRGGMGLHLAIGVGLGAVYIFLSKFSITFASDPKVPALLGVWIPNIIFGCIAIYLLSRAQK
ncbi:MAG: LptF/LptG family permease [Saprospiraceae bacterium]|nr:LptF/LptG family permease [Saprospiraceae bacterium]